MRHSVLCTGPEFPRLVPIAQITSPETGTGTVIPCVQTAGGWRARHVGRAAIRKEEAETRLHSGWSSFWNGWGIGDKWRRSTARSRQTGIRRKSAIILLTLRSNLNFISINFLQKLDADEPRIRQKRSDMEAPSKSSHRFNDELWDHQWYMVS